jgi:hypothetical protein
MHSARSFNITPIARISKPQRLCSQNQMRPQDQAEANAKFTRFKKVVAGRSHKPTFLFVSMECETKNRKPMIQERPSSAAAR